MFKIESRNNPRYKFAGSLVNKRGRVKAGALLVEGYLELQAALDANLKILDVFYCEDYLTTKDMEVQSRLREVPDLKPAYIPANLMGAISYRDECGVLIAFKSPDFKQVGACAAAKGLHIILEQPAKPGNLGAVVRTASAVGATKVITVGPSVDRWNPNAIRSSIGSVFSLPVLQYADWDKFRSDFAELKLVALDPAGQELDAPTDFEHDIGLVFGAESSGLTGEAKQVCGKSVRLPMDGVVNSLNLSVSVGVAAYAWRWGHTTVPF
jgi:TrmH family RNA methyltransferase